MSFVIPPPHKSKFLWFVLSLIFYWKSDSLFQRIIENQFTLIQYKTKTNGITKAGGKYLPNINSHAWDFSQIHCGVRGGGGVSLQGEGGHEMGYECTLAGWTGSMNYLPKYWGRHGDFGIYILKLNNEKKNI